MDNELLLLDRIGVIKDTILKYGVDNFYLSYSGGKDSTVLHYLIDMALPDNNIPRLFLNTGIEYNDLVKYVNDMAAADPRIVVYNVGVNIKEMLEKDGYPFKSKEHAKKLHEYQVHEGPMTPYINSYVNAIRSARYACPKILKYQFTPEYSLKVSHYCCDRLKKEPAKKWAKLNNKNIVITGIRAEEGGARVQKPCIISDHKGGIKKFNPLIKVNNEWLTWFIERYNIKLCKLYYPPYSFERTGCKGCPFALKLQEQLNTMKELLPNEYKQCEILWAPVYKEYRRLNYRLKEVSK